MKLNQYSHQSSVSLSLYLLLMLVIQVIGTELSGDNNGNQTSAVNQPEVETTTQEVTTIGIVNTSPQQQRGGTDIVIKSMEDGLLISGKSSSDRHHYEQQAEAVTEAPAKSATTVAPTVVTVTVDDPDSYHGPTKPEPRNQQDEQQDPVIIDHRPAPDQPQLVSQQQQQQQDYAPTQTPQTTTQAPQYRTQQSGSSPAVAATNLVPVYSTATTSGQQQQSPPNTATTSWYSVPAQQIPAYQPIVTYAQASMQPAVSTASQYGTSLMAQPSNQVISIQHPTSINSIISEQQNQQQQLQTQPLLQQALPVSSAQNQQSQQIVSVNGQPMILVNPNSLVNGGRRVSISGWLKGISSMLANIFNRREHGGQLAGQSSTALGHWIQLGPNSPHWLSTAQTVAQQTQYQQQQLQQQFNNQRPTHQVLASAGTNRYTYISAPNGGSGQQVGPTTIAISSAPQMTATQQQFVLPQQQQQIQYQQTSGQDLQASGSSTSYVTVAPPASINSQGSQQQQHVVAIGQYAPQTIGNQPQTSTSPAPIISVAGTVTQAVASTTGTRQSSTGQSRFGRSSTSSSSGLPLAHYSRYATSAD